MKRVSILLAAVLMLSCATMAQKSKWREASRALSSGKLDKAKECIDVALQDADMQKEAKAYFTKGEIYQKISEDPTGLYKKLDANAAMKAYEAYVQAGKLDVKGKLKKKLKTNLTNLTNAMANEGAKLYEQNNFKEAANRFEKVLEIENSKLVGANAIDTTMMFNVALAAEKAKDYERAVKYYTKVKDYGYQEAKTYARLSSVLKESGKGAEATALLEEGAKKYPNDLNIIFELINVNLLGGTPEKAKEYVDKAIELEPKNASLYRAKGSIYVKTGNFEEAKNWYQKALDIDPNDFTSQYALSVMLLQKINKRLEEVNKITNMEEYDAAMKGVFDQYAEAIPYFEKAHKLNPKDTDTIKWLKEICFKLRDRSPEMMKKYESYKAMLE